MKKVLAVFLSAALLLSAAACSGGKEAGTGGSSAESENSAAEASQTGTEKNGDPYFKKYDEEIKLTTHMTFPSNWKWVKPGDNANNNGQTRWLKKHMNIDISCAWSAPDSDTDAQKLELAFASDKLPDVIQGTPEQISKYAAAGKLVAIEPLIEKYGSPLVKYGIEQAKEITRGSFYQPFSYKGQAYALPIMSDTLANWWLNYIRADVLKELGKKVPANIAELEDVFAAYHAKYPDKVCLGLDNGLAAGKMQLVMSAYNAYPTSWIEKDGRVAYGSIQPEVKQGLQKMAEWYQKGYIDHEFVTKDADRMYQDVAAGNVLSLWTAWSIIGGPFQDLWNNVKGSQMTPMPFLANENGKSGICDKVWFSVSRAITTKCEHPEAFVYMLNEAWDSFYRNNEQLRDLMKTKYNYDFRYPVTKLRTAVNEKDAVATGAERQYDYPEELTGFGFFDDFQQHYSWLYGLTGAIPQIANSQFGEVAEAVKRGGEYDGMSPDAKTTYTGWGGGKVGKQMLSTFAEIYNYFDPLQSNSDVFHADAFPGASTKTMVEKQTYLQKLETEAFTRIIMGTQPLSFFDDFVSQWKANGGDQITKEVNEWKASAK